MIFKALTTPPAMFQDPKYINKMRCGQPPFVIQRTSGGYLLSEKIQPAVILGLLFASIFLLFFWFLPLVLICLPFFRPFRQFIRARFFLLPGELIFSRYPLHLGGSDRVTFRRRLKGNRKFPSNGSVKIKLLCLERVSYTKGTNIIVETAMIEEKLLRSQSIMSGLNEINCQFNLDIPADRPPSFEAIRNQIRWVIVVEQNMPGIAENIDSNYTLLVES